MISKIYINGDSYSVHPNSYGKIIGNKLNLQVTNHAIPGSSNDRIIRSTIEYLLINKASAENLLVIIGFSFITREEIWVDTNKQIHLTDTIAGSRFTTFQRLMDGDIESIEKEKFINTDINGQVIHFYYKLYMLISLLKSMNCKYLIFSAADNSDWPKLKWDFLKKLKIYEEISKEENIIGNIHEFSIPKWAKQNNLSTSHTGHMNDDGHAKFADFLLEKIKELT